MSPRKKLAILVAMIVAAWTPIIAAILLVRWMLQS